MAELSRNVAVYPYTVEIAKKYSQMPLWYQSWQHNCLCAHEMDSLIRLRVWESSDNEAIRKLLGKYGIQRPMFLIALAIKDKRSRGKDFEELHLGLRRWALNVYPLALPRREYLLKASAQELNLFVQFCRNYEEAENISAPVVSSATKENTAKALLYFAKCSDFYDYMDQVEDEDAEYGRILTDLNSGKFEDYVNVLADLVMDSRDESEIEGAMDLLDQLNELAILEQR